jgi:hypothetical protein
MVSSHSPLFTALESCYSLEKLRASYYAAVADGSSFWVGLSFEKARQHKDAKAIVGAVCDARISLLLGRRAIIDRAYNGLSVLENSNQTITQILY